jgi:hypothetical protein
MALYGGRPPAQLTLTDAIMTGFRTAIQPNFVIPILVIGVVVNLVVMAAFVPLLAPIIGGGSTSAALIGGAFISGIVGALVASTIGGILLNLYGQVWATMASVGDAPTMQVAFARVNERWMSILGAGLISAGATLGIMLVGGLLSAVLGALGILLFLVTIVVVIYVGARLSLAGWLAADGAGAMDAVRGSWELSGSKLLLIVGWVLAYGIVFAIVGGTLGAILGFIPLIGSALATTVGSAFGFGAGVTLYRKVKSA